MRVRMTENLQQCNYSFKFYHTAIVKVMSELVASFSLARAVCQLGSSVKAGRLSLLPLH